MTIATVAGSFAGVGPSTSIELIGPFNFSLAGTFVATVKLERSFDRGVSWLVVSQNALGDEAAYTTPISLQGEEWERGVRYRVNCTAFTSGSVTYRLSQ